MPDKAVEAAFQRACAAIDEAWQLVRAMHASDASYRVPTLSDSLAEPREHHVEATLVHARILIQNDIDRDALCAIARASRMQGLLSEGAFQRLVKGYRE